MNVENFFGIELPSVQLVKRFEKFSCNASLLTDYINFSQLYLYDLRLISYNFGMFVSLSVCLFVYFSEAQALRFPAHQIIWVNE